ncbi:MAG TPA: DUF4129 domain-containing protein [Anaerolineales bacterium]|nr:DUF4129 domain-containing protein [Anaerolineales bacterium]
MISGETDRKGGGAGMDHNRFRPWRELAVLGAMLMSLSWGVPWFRSLTQATFAVSTGYAFLVFGVMMLGSYVVVRLMNAARLRIELRRGIILVLLAAGILIGLKTLLFAGEELTFSDLMQRQLRSFADAFDLIPDEFIVTVGVLLVWRSGTRLATEKIGPRLIQRAFGTGFGMFFLYVFFNTFVTGETPGNMPVLFLFAGLMAMGAARVSVIGTLRGGRDNPFDRRWVAGLTISAAGAVGVAAWLGAEISGGEGLIALVPRLGLGVIMGAAFLLLTPLFALLWWALYLVVDTLSTENPLSESLTDLFNGLQGMATGLFELLEPFLGPLGTFLARFGLVTKVVILWVVVLGLALAVLLAIYIRDERRRRQLFEQLEQIRSDGLWKSLRDSLRKRLEEAGRSMAGLFDADRRRRLLAAARIRRIYARLMNLCEDLDAPRPAASTPHEFVPMMAELFTGGADDLSLITDAYQQVRYGELPERAEAVEQVEAAWERVQAEGKRLLNNKRPDRGPVRAG